MFGIRLPFLKFDCVVLPVPRQLFLASAFIVVILSPSMLVFKSTTKSAETITGEQLALRAQEQMQASWLRMMQTTEAGIEWRIIEGPSCSNLPQWPPMPFAIQQFLVGFPRELDQKHFLRKRVFLSSFGCCPLVMAWFWADLPKFDGHDFHGR